MNQRSIEIRGVDTLFLYLKGDLPSKATIRAWKMHVGTVVLVRYDSEQERKISSEYREVLNGVQVLWVDNNTNILKEVVRENETAEENDIVIVDDPNLLRSSVDPVQALIIGVSKPGKSTRDLYDEGATLVLDTFEQITVSGGSEKSVSFIQNLPSAFSDVHKFQVPLDQEQSIFFFDYDGTLSPIVQDPSKAHIDNHIRDLLYQLGQRVPVAIVSGRDINDIKDFVRLDNLIYAGSHGFRISGPDGLQMEHPRGSELLPQLNKMEQQLRTDLESEFQGVEVERKQYAIAVHYRNASREAAREVKKRTHRIGQQEPSFETGPGKMIREIKPSVDWHKGKAIEWIMDQLGYSLNEGANAWYIGDDITDEDAFRVLSGFGTGILVGNHMRPTAAHYHLNDVDEVTKFLHYLVRSA